MLGVLYSVMAGVFICLQSVFNTRVSEKAGFWLTNTFVHGSGFLLSLIIFWLIRDGSAHKLQTVNKMYLLGGVCGVIIVFSIMKAITSLGPAYSVAIVLISQLVIMLLFESFGLFGTEKIPLSANRLIGIGVMAVGVIVYKLK
ncbi:DMT family transporter [Paenibacillus beijingensis]|uniref:Membrane protein n=1 Tax=Paenibacillus beijingensis TaxID=1126833 RepID=A0A0D5NEB7_9BACL|nr:DMT family transporter [Paenibacillus beijingensis]AJY73709.1 membrane protein [Paenibacillus beijingensis]